MEGLKPPGELSFEGNVAENWRKWCRQFQNYLRAINLVQEPVVDRNNPPAGNAAISARQVAILLHTAGEEAYEIYSQFEYEDGHDENTLADVISGSPSMRSFSLLEARLKTNLQSNILSCTSPNSHLAACVLSRFKKVSTDSPSPCDNPQKIYHS